MTVCSRCDVERIFDKAYLQKNENNLAPYSAKTGADICGEIELDKEKAKQSRGLARIVGMESVQLALDVLMINGEQGSQVGVISIIDTQIPLQSLPHVELVWKFTARPDSGTAVLSVSHVRVRSSYRVQDARYSFQTCL